MIYNVTIMNEILWFIPDSKVVVGREVKLSVQEGNGEQLNILSSGIRLDIPYRNRPSNIITMLTLKVILAAEITFPEDYYQPIGPILYITSNEPFKEDIHISIKHNAIVRVDREKSQIKFLISYSDSIPYEFLAENEVNSDFMYDEYATLSMSTFCFIMPVFKLLCSPWSFQRRPCQCLYGYYIFYRELNNNTIQIAFAITKRQDDYLNVSVV